MKTLISFAVALMAAGILHAEHIALIGGTVINPADGKITRNATVFIDNGRISSIAAGMVMKYSGRTINCVGKFILPGYIDTHVHFFQSADLFTRPDGADFNTVRPYKDEVAWIKSHLDDVFTRYLRCGITSVVDVGGPMWNFEVRKKANATEKAPRVAVAGPTRSWRSADRKDRHARAGARVRTKARRTETGFGEDLVHRR